MLSFSRLEVELVEGVTRIVGNDNKRYFGKEGKILKIAFGFRCTLCSFRVLVHFCLVYKYLLKYCSFEITHRIALLHFKCFAKTL